MVDKLIVGAFIEAIICERFAKIAAHVDKKLGDFYIYLLHWEARHYQGYLTLAAKVAGRLLLNVLITSLISKQNYVLAPMKTLSVKAFYLHKYSEVSKYFPVLRLY